MSITRTSARFDEERGRFDATRAQLDVRAMKLVEERAALDVKSAYLEDRLAKLRDEEGVLEQRKRELTKLGRETLDKSHALAQTMQSFAELKGEHEAMKARVAESERRARDVEHEKARVDKTVLQLQQERLLVAKQRVQSRQFLEGARRLEGMLQQQKELELTGERPSNNQSSR